MTTKKKLKDLTHEKVLKLFDYNPDTGVITRKSTGKIATFSDGSHGYLRISAQGVSLSAHRFIWFYVHGFWPANQIDHINRIRDDNRLENLRDVSTKVNARNRTVDKESPSGVNGVNYSKARRKWIARIKVDGENLLLGRYNYKDQAIIARQAAEKALRFYE